MITNKAVPAGWFEMPDVLRCRVAESVWVPLRRSETIHYSDGRQETFALGCIAFPPKERANAESLSWHDLGVGRSGGPYAFQSHVYKPVEVYQYHEGQDMGVDLIFEQYPGNGCPRIWHLSQDLIIAMNLTKEGDCWLRPDEGFAQIVRERRNTEGEVCAIEMRAEFLRDYLAARGLALRVAYYHQRMAMLADASHIPWLANGLERDQLHDRFSARVYEVDETGGPFGAGVAIFHIARTDIYPEDDVPIFGAPDDTNTAGTSTKYNRGGTKFFQVEGELWREEWIEPAARSERVRGDDPTDIITYLIDAGGARANHTDLNNEDVGRYLWFSPGVVNALCGIRGGGHQWYTTETARVWATEGWPVHFGVNQLGLINVYAYDVARLPIWQQRIWAGYNVSPDGGVSAELLQAQMEGRPASTTAPEARLTLALSTLDDAATGWLGSPLFNDHESFQSILLTIHRFRALDQQGILALAKDLARLIADRIDIEPLRKIATPPKGERWGSQKSLEKALATIVPVERARSLLTPLVGIYDLRLGDAHLPFAEIEKAFEMAGVDSAAPSMVQGRKLIDVAAAALLEIRDTILVHLESSADRSPVPSNS